YADSFMVWLKRDSLGIQPAKPAEEWAAAIAPSPARKEDPVARQAEVLERIRKLIGDGHFPPGSRLPPERALAVQLGVGRPSLREAIKALGVLDVLESRRGAGTFVKSRLPQPTASDAAKADFNMLELLEVRKIVEPRAAWLAAARAGERHLLEIESARQKLEMHDRDWKLVASLDSALHAAIIRGAQNAALEFIGGILMSHMFANQSYAIRFAPDVERMRREHKAIVESILKRQSDAAEKAMLDHLHSAGLDFISEASGR
ncbi:MAG: GntR family transcriptional regulator, partial [Acidobacteria bacterium]|nr:GntR family transcriptional regulator [Acidobacteriota bacterium]